MEQRKPARGLIPSGACRDGSSAPLAKPKRPAETWFSGRLARRRPALGWSERTRADERRRLAPEPMGRGIEGTELAGGTDKPSPLSSAGLRRAAAVREREPHLR